MRQWCEGEEKFWRKLHLWVYEKSGKHHTNPNKDLKQRSWIFCLFAMGFKHNKKLILIFQVSFVFNTLLQVSKSLERGCDYWSKHQGPAASLTGREEFSSTVLEVRKDVGLDAEYASQHPPWFQSFKTTFTNRTTYRADIVETVCFL